MLVRWTAFSGRRRTNSIQYHVRPFVRFSGKDGFRCVLRRGESAMVGRSETTSTGHGGGVKSVAIIWYLETTERERERERFETDRDLGPVRSVIRSTAERPHRYPTRYPTRYPKKTSDLATSCCAKMCCQPWLCLWKRHTCCTVGRSRYKTQ